MATGSTETTRPWVPASDVGPPPPPPTPPPGIDEATLMAAARAAVGLAPLQNPGQANDPQRDRSPATPNPASPNPASDDPANANPASGDPANADPAGSPPEPAPDQPAPAVATPSRLQAAGRLAIIVLAAAGIAAALASWVSLSVLGDGQTGPAPPPTGVFSGDNRDEPVDTRTAPDTGPDSAPESGSVGTDAERAFVEAAGVRYTWASDTGRAADVTVERRTGNLIVRFDDGTRFRQLGGIWEQQDDAGVWRTLDQTEAPPVDVSRLAPTSGAMRPNGAVPSAFDPFTLSRESEINAVGNQEIRLTLDDISLNRHDVELRAFWMERWGLDPAVVSVAPLAITMVVTPEGFVRSMRISLTAFETGIDYGLVDLYDEPPRLEF